METSVNLLCWFGLLFFCIAALFRYFRPYRGLLEPPPKYPSTKRTDSSFGLFERWYASHPAPHQHAHVFIVAKDFLAKDIPQAVSTVVLHLECLQVCLVPSTDPILFQFSRMATDVPLPVCTVTHTKNWKEVLIESVDTSMMEVRKYLWRLHIVPSENDEVALVFTFNHMITDGHGSLGILSHFLQELLFFPTNTPYVPFGPKLETVLDVRPTLGFMLHQVLNDKIESFFSQTKKFSRVETYKNLSELSTGMEFIEIDMFTTRCLLKKCRHHNLTLNALLVAAHFLSYTAIKRTNANKTGADLVDLLCAISLRNTLNVPLPTGCGGNYLTGTTFTRTIKHSVTEVFKACLEGDKELEPDDEQFVWDLAESVKKEQKVKEKDNVTNIGLTVWIGEPLRNWMLRKSKENTYYGRTAVLGISNLTRVDFGLDATNKDSLTKTIKSVWFAQSNRDATGPLIESCIETFEGNLRIVCCYCKPALSSEEANTFATTLTCLLKKLSL